MLGLDGALFFYCLIYYRSQGFNLYQISKNELYCAKCSFFAHLVNKISQFQHFLNE
jgi:hypothetical protein